jgi:hypothetical protein
MLAQKHQKLITKRVETQRDAETWSELHSTPTDDCREGGEKMVGSREGLGRREGVDELGEHIQVIAIYRERCTPTRTAWRCI